jgi:hypothetical protein
MVDPSALTAWQTLHPATTTVGVACPGRRLMMAPVFPAMTELYEL